VRAYRRERLENAIAYIIKIHQLLSKKEAAQTYIYKYLALIDFRSIEETGKPVFDVDYDAFDKGPVPKNLYDYRDFIVDKEDEFDVIKLESNSEDNYIYKLKKEPNLDYLSDYEIELIESTVEEYANKSVVTKDLIEATHEKIKAWQVAWKNRGSKGRVPINFLHTFDEILDKDLDSLLPKEEVALVYNTLLSELKQRCV